MYINVLLNAYVHFSQISRFGFWFAEEILVILFAIKSVHQILQLLLPTIFPHGGRAKVLSAWVRQISAKILSKFWQNV